MESPNTSAERAPRQGWFIKERNGKFQAQAWDPNRRKHEAKTFANRDQAREWAKRRHAELLLKIAPLPGSDGTVPLKGVGDAYIQELMLRNAAPEHLSQVQRVIREAVAAGIDDLRSPICVGKTRAFLIALRKLNGQPASTATRNSYLTKLRTIGHFAIRQDLIGKNPFLKIDKGRVPVPLKRVFGLDEVRHLVNPANASHSFYLPFCSMIYTGLRGGEMAKMEWQWFRWQEARIAMTMSRRARAYRGSTGELVPKNGCARLVRMMAEYANLMRPVAAISGPVFPDLYNASRDHRQNRFDSYLEHCKVPIDGRTPHSCRHTWVGLLLASGETESMVQLYAGHSEQEMTAHYGASRDLFRDQVEREAWKRGELSLMSAPANREALSGPGAI